MRSWTSPALALALALISTEAAAQPCSADAFGMSIIDVRFAMVPMPAQELGLDLSARSLAFGWGRGCGGYRHELAISTAEAPDYGDPNAASFVSFGDYRLMWHEPRWDAYVGARAITLWGDDRRLLTPVAGGHLRPAPRVELGVAIESGGVFAWSNEGAERRFLSDLAVGLSAAYTLSPARRLELRIRARDYHGGLTTDVTTGEMWMQRTRDVTGTAGISVAFAGRDGMRALPVFFGFASRHNGAGATLLAVFECNFGTTR